jgi:hypothetical protein
MGEDENGSGYWRTDVRMASGLVAWDAGWVAHSPEPVKAMLKITSSLLLRRGKAHRSVLTLSFSTSTRGCEERRTVIRAGNDGVTEPLPQRALAKMLILSAAVGTPRLRSRAW